MSTQRKIPVQVYVKGDILLVPCPETNTVGWLMQEACKRYQKSHPTEPEVKLQKITTDKGATLEQDDLLSDVVTPNQVLKTFEDKPEVQEVSDENPGFTVERKPIYDAETNAELGVQLILTFIEQNLIDSLKNYVSTETLYEKQPRFNAESLLQYLPQFKKSTSYKKWLTPLINFLEKEYADITEKINKMVAENKISYTSLWYIFPPETYIKTNVREHILGAKITQAKYNKSCFFPSFEVYATAIKSNGQQFYKDTIHISIPAFTGVKKVEDMPMSLLDEETKARLAKRGEMFLKMGKGSHYTAYHGNMERKAYWTYNLMKADGRIMVDAANFCKNNPNYSVFDRSVEGENVLPTLHGDHMFMTWPTIGGFSFTTKKWGEIAIENVRDIIFDDKAFEKLVLPAEKKKLIKSLVENANQSFSDIVSGKGGGCIFLLHGTPGVGKTLTAEAIAELLRRPLYSVTVGELGTHTKELEDTLREILDLASAWNAVILIDEADIFLERRTENDIKRNAMVGIFLRLLEYHQGVLFLTTNRVACFDEAFHSRISIALKYEELDQSAREKIWGNLLATAHITGLNPKELAKHDLNGRQIRSTIRLAQSLAYSENTTVSLEHINRTVDVANQFVSDLLTERKALSAAAN